MINTPPFVTALASISMQASMLVLIALLVSYLFRHHLPGNWRYALWCLVLLRFAIPAGPESSLSLENLVAINNSDDRRGSAGAMLIGWLPAGASALNAAEENWEQAEAGQTQERILTPAISHIIMSIWAAGFLLVTSLTIVSYHRISKMRKSCVKATDSRLLAILVDCCRLAGTSANVSLFISDEIHAPMLTGLFRPAIILPRAVAEGNSSEDLEFIIYHELAHLRRGDLWIGLAVAAIQAVHWFNPFVWIAVKQLRASREIACDAVVVKLVGKDRAAAYGRTLLALAEQISAVRSIGNSMGIVEVKSETGKRVTMLYQSLNTGWKTTMTGLTILAVLLVVSFTKAEQLPASSAVSPTSVENVTASPNSVSPTDNSLLAGNKPFTLTTDPNVGELLYEFDNTSKNLKTITARNGVTFSTNTTTITGEFLMYSVKDNNVEVAGPGLKADIGELGITAEKLNYWPGLEEIVLEGNVVIHQKDSKGRTTVTTADKIRIQLIDGKTRLFNNSGYEMRIDRGDPTVS